MRIVITSGIGEGINNISAFDAALMNAGIGNYNIIKLSSIIPPDSEIQIRRGITQTNNNEYGKRLYVVISTRIGVEINREVWAGLGWVQEKENLRGLFVEVSGSSELDVQQEIRKTLACMMLNRMGNFGDVQTEVVGSICKGNPICVLVAAIYQSEEW